MRLRPSFTRALRSVLRLFVRLTVEPGRAVRALARPEAGRVGLALWCAQVALLLALLAGATLPFGVRARDAVPLLALAAALTAALLAWASAVTWAVVRAAGGRLRLRAAVGLSAALAGWSGVWMLVLTAALVLPVLHDLRLVALLYLPAALLLAARAALVGLFARERLGAGLVGAARAAALWCVLYAPAAAAAAAGPLRGAFGLREIDQRSMLPTLREHEIVVVNRLAPVLGGLERWDVVLFRATGRTGSGEAYIKRLVGLPGEEVVLLPGRLLIDRREPALPAGWPRSPYEPGGERMHPLLGRDAPGPGAVAARCGAGEHFLLGDNSGHSRDSRRTGPVRRERLLGRAFLRIPTRASAPGPEARGLSFLRRYGAP